VIWLVWLGRVTVISTWVRAFLVLAPVRKSR
jgi:hypothetical protein